MLLRLAIGNVRRSAQDFSVYFSTLAFAVCLLYSFLASTDYLLALDLTAGQRARFAQSGQVLVAFSVLVAVIFAFLVGYANMFLVRRRAREFGLYELLGMGPARTAVVLAAESGTVCATALVAGVALGTVLSPAFCLIAAFVFDAPWAPVFTCSASAAGRTIAAFCAIMVLAALSAVRRVRRAPLIELMGMARVPERRLLTGAGSLRAQGLLAFVLLAVVWGTCLLFPGYFIVFIVPMGFIALGGTYFAFRVLAARVPHHLRARAERYLSGLMPFTVRQLESRIESGCAALSAVCVLLAAGMCMLVAGMVLCVGLRAGGLLESSRALAPLAYACIFYGAAFLIAATAVLALQQLSQTVDSAPSYRLLKQLGVDRRDLRASVRLQVAVPFAVPFTMACVHCVFGFILIGALSIMFASRGFPLFAAATLSLTLAVLAAYCVVTASACERILLR